MKNILSILSMASLILFCSIVIIAQDTEEPTPKARKLIELEIEGVYEYGSSYLVRLNEIGNLDWALSMFIGGCEADGIARSVAGVDFSRPLTYDVFESIFDQTSLELEHVIITKLVDGTFYAVLVIDDNGKNIEIDARPSDCINIAMKTGVKIYASNTVWDENKEKIE